MNIIYMKTFIVIEINDNDYFLNHKQSKIQYLLYKFIIMNHIQLHFIFLNLPNQFGLLLVTFHLIGIGFPSNCFNFHSLSNIYIQFE